MTACEPFAASIPDHDPDGVQVVAPFEVHVTVVATPAVSRLGDASSVSETERDVAATSLYGTDATSNSISLSWPWFGAAGTSVLGVAQSASATATFVNSRLTFVALPAPPI